LSTDNNLDLNSFPTRRSSDLGPHEFTRRGRTRISNPDDKIRSRPSGMECSANSLTPFRDLEYLHDFLHRSHSCCRQGASLGLEVDRKSTRLNSSHRTISYAVF